MLTWKDSRQMAQYTTETGKLLPRKYTRLSAKQQRHMKRQVKRARNMLVMP
jgi:small subunit ribosomal protein S18